MTTIASRPSASARNHSARSKAPGGGHGLARVEYPTGHKDYADILEHLGGLKPGESKLVPPWPE